VWKGDSDARIQREMELGRRVFWRNDKRMSAQPRRQIFQPAPDEGRYSCWRLRVLRGLNGVGRLAK